MNIAMITARGGSKRIPRKNIKEFCGKPILAYSIEAALQSDIFDGVMISTEDDEIAAIGQAYGASFPFRRSNENAGDYAATIDVMMEVVEQYQEQGITPEIICCIYPTAPFVTAKKLREAYEIMKRTDAEAVIPIVRFSYPPQRCFVSKGNYIEYKWKEYVRSRSQDLEPYYHDAGQFYFIRTRAMLEQRTLIPKKTAPYILSEMEVQDIDTMSDWELAENKYKIMKNKK